MFMPGVCFLLSKKKIKVVTFKSLTTNLCKKYKSNIILRGLRAVSDFEYEFQLAGMNRKLNNNIETIFLMSNVENQIISSNFVKSETSFDLYPSFLIFLKVPPELIIFILCFLRHFRRKFQHKCY